jgi:membrane protease YdiL (CAAX protease family)
VGAASPLLGLAVGALLAGPGAFRPAARPWVVAFLATLLLGLAAPALPALVPGTRLIGVRWNWSGQLLTLAGTLWVAALLVRHAGLSWLGMGFTWAQRKGSIRPALVWAGAALSLNIGLMRLGSFRLPGVSLETWLYQATLPGLVEETLFRGVLLALLDRAFVARRRLFGASLGWGAVVVTLVFLALHGIRVGTLLGVLPLALLTLWLRALTGSLVLPVALHNLWNLSVHAAHL